MEMSLCFSAEWKSGRVTDDASSGDGKSEPSQSAGSTDVEILRRERQITSV